MLENRKINLLGLSQNGHLQTISTSECDNPFMNIATIDNNHIVAAFRVN